MLNGAHQTVLREGDTERERDEQPSQVQTIPSHAKLLVLQAEGHEETQASKQKKQGNNKNL